MTRKYGKKRPAASAAAVAIFGSTPQSVASVTKDSTTILKSQYPQRDLTEVTDLLENTTLKESTDEVAVLLEKTSLESHVDNLNKPLDLENIRQDSSSKDAPRILDETILDSTIETITCLEKSLAAIEPKIEIPIPQTPVSLSPTPLPINPRLAASLLPLLAAYEKDNGYPLATKNWDDVLAPGSSIQKIAEASYAEVFRITNPVGSSILKLLRLKVPTDPTSKKSDTAIKVDTVVSEMRLMNALTEIPGFVNFKDAHIVEGKPPAAFVTAYEGYLDAGGESYFPHPNKISKHAVFLAIELGDAGHVLEKYPIKNVDQLWDIFLGVVIALARAEIEHEFEHRDLHENNICILERIPPSDAPKANPKSRSKTKPQNPPSPHKFGNSGLEITILDYGLSRATIYPVSSTSNPSPAPETVFYNLESDTAVFSSFEPSSIAGIQFDTYRRMRAYLFSGGLSNTNANTPSKAIRDAIKQKKHSWEEYMPYSNVLWLYFLMEYLTEVAPKGGRGKKGRQAWVKETEELRWLLDPDWVPGNVASDDKEECGDEGEEEEELGLGCAGDVLQYAFDMGWVCEEDLGGADTSRLSLREDSSLELEKKKKSLSSPK
ncbi:hypothetical protein BCIN_07g05570 [Botrytis cinerea B05.10]|uniref:non-specific serine/threonine protein kinase n=1 Tax=Botryotinia fuckeliana (strain B05.10) TaxID=332648 RepID=A0A384JNE4_BOTFB|nr:hypothetical protein BCIN_07g05570 [Botrytis cinerea B05.10]ATZ52030.1 hypothetical protein BCIN_07g05570 [Botrytis cinerea B05.10]